MPHPVPKCPATLLEADSEDAVIVIGGSCLVSTFSNCTGGAFTITGCVFRGTVVATWAEVTAYRGTCTVDAVIAVEDGDTSRLSAFPICVPDPTVP